MGFLINKENESIIKDSFMGSKENVYRALKEDAFDFYIKKESFGITFLAFSKSIDLKLPISISIHVDNQGRFMRNQIRYAEEIAFMKYLYELEASVDEEGLKKLYAPLGEDFINDLLMDEKTRRKKIKARENFLYYLEDEKLDKIKTSVVVDKYQVIYSFSTIYDFFSNEKENVIYPNITIITPEGKRRTIQKIENYLDAFNNEKDFTQSGLTIYTSEEYYTELDYKLLTILAKKYVGRSYYNEGLDINSFAEFLLLDQGHNIIFDNKNVHINEEIIEEEFKLDEHGEIILPKIPYFISYKNYIIEFTTLNIIFHEYKDVILAKITKYLLGHKKDDIKFIKDLVIKEAKKSPYFVISLTEGYRIELYVDLNENDFLVFKTRYMFNEEEINKEKYLNLENNRLIYDNFISELNKIGGIEKGEEKDQGRILLFLYSDYISLSNYASLYLSSRIKSLHKTSLPTVNVSINYNNDFLNVDFDMDNLSEEEMKALLNAYKHKKKYFLVKDRLIKLEDEENVIDSLLEFVEDYDISFNDITSASLPKYAYFSLINIANKDLKIKKDKFIDEFVDKLSNYEATSLSLTPAINEKARPYQLRGIKWLKTLYELELGAILADDMGLGKSLQTVGLISEIKEEKPMLIICPKSVTYNWANEIVTWSNNEKVVVLSDAKIIREEKIKNIKNDKRIIYITSYDSLRNDLELYNEKEFALLVADEAQFIKNAYAKKSKAIKTLTASFKLALTGTPIENSLADLWSIFDFIMKGYLSTFDKFRHKYIDNSEMLDNLKKKVSPFIMRRIKKDVLRDLPKKEVIVQTLSMNEEERKLYNVTLIDARKKLEMADSSFSMFPVLTSLREICVDPMIFYENYKEESTKFDYVISLLEEGIQSGHKFLIFSTFASVLHHLEDILIKKDIPNYLIDGKVGAEARIEYGKDFNEFNDVNVMLVSLKAGGTGLNLHGADIVIHLDPWWNFAAEEQATDRAHRIGQTRPVTVYKLIMHNSIEEKVMKLQEMKKELNSAVIGIDEDNSTKITKEDIKYLLS